MDTENVTIDKFERLKNALKRLDQVTQKELNDMKPATVKPPVSYHKGLTYTRNLVEGDVKKKIENFQFYHT